MLNHQVTIKSFPANIFMWCPLYFNWYLSVDQHENEYPFVLSHRVEVQESMHSPWENSVGDPIIISLRNDYLWKDVGC